MEELPRLVSPLKTPKIIWHQTDVCVVLRILLTDVQDYFLLVDGNHLRFSTTVGERKYYLIVYLFGAVIAEKCTHSNLGREIRVTLPKGHKWTDWPRLCIDKHKNPHISYDTERVEKQKIRIKRYKVWENFNEYKRINNITTILPDAPSSDENDSDDEKMDALFELI